MEKHSMKVVAALLSAVFLMSACSGNTDDSSKEKSDGLLGALSDAKDKASATVDSLKIDKDLPLEKYVPIESGNQLMFLYYAISSMPVDYEKIATTYSAEFNRTTDGFKKQDILQALKPRIDAEISKAKEGRYILLEEGAKLDSFDFSSGGFPVGNGLDAGTYGYFYDNSGYQYSYVNGGNYKLLKVSDEAKARSIESLRSKYPGMRLQFYAYVQDADPSNQRLKCEIVKVRLLDSQGAELWLQ